MRTLRWPWPTPSLHRSKYASPLAPRTRHHHLRTPRERPCFACGKLDHMIADCKDEAAVAKWRADAPARLARRQARVAACVAVLGGEVDENVLDESEFEMLDEVSSLAAMEPEGFAHLCGLCDLGLPEGAFRDGGRSEDVPEARE